MLHLTAKDFTATVNHSSGPVVVMFYAAWCNKCAMMKPLVEDIEKMYEGRILFCEVNIDESKALADRFHADIVPTFAFFSDGAHLSTVKGVFSEITFERQLQKIFINC